MQIYDMTVSSVSPAGESKDFSAEFAGQDLRIDIAGGRQATLAVTRGWRWGRNGEKIPAPGRLVLAETGQTIGNGDPSVSLERDETTVLLTAPFDGWRVRMTLARQPRKRVVDGPPGKTCGQCSIFDRVEGARALTEKTHLRATREGGYCFVDVVARSLADECRGAYLHPNIAGYCPRHRELLHEKAEACRDFLPAKIGAWERAWAWLRRVFGPRKGAR